MDTKEPHRMADVLREVEGRLHAVGAAFPRPGGTLSVERFLDDTRWITSMNEGAVLAKVRSADPGDSHEVRRWYEPNPSDQPTYADDPQWKQWWVDLLEDPNRGVDVFKLTLEEDEPAPHTLGFLAVKNVNDWHDDGAPTLYVNGLRINPNLMPHEKTMRAYHGVGAALITFAVILSLRRDQQGIGVNSSLGVEGFYHRLGMKAIPAHDGQRTYWMLKGRQERADFLADRYRHALLALSTKA